MMISVRRSTYFRKSCKHFDRIQIQLVAYCSNLA